MKKEIETKEMREKEEKSHREQKNKDTEKGMVLVERETGRISRLSVTESQHWPCSARLLRVSGDQLTGVVVSEVILKGGSLLLLLNTEL